MKLRCALLSLAMVGAAAAQSSSLPIGLVSGAGQYIWVPAPTAASSVGFFFDVTVANTLTFQGVSFPSYTPLDQAMTLEMWVTNSGITTYVGSETNQANWTQRATGASTIVGAPATNYVCLGSGVTLNPGTYGVVFIVHNANNLFSNLGPQTFSNADMTVNVGAVSAATFSTAPSAYGTNTFYFNGALHYSLGAITSSCASKASYGTGCNILSGSFWQKWTSNAAMSASLNGRKLSLLFNGTNYTLTQGLSTVAYIPPSASATTLPTSNNGETTVALNSPFPYPGGSTPQLVIATDGHISPVSNLPFPGQNYNFMPFQRGVLDALNPIWAVCWHNFNTTELNSGLIKHETLGNLFVVTWDNVESFPGSTTAQTANPCTFQAQFDLTTGDVHFVYQSMTAIGGSQSYDETVIGYSPGGPSPDAGPIDVATLTALVLPSVEVLPLTLTVSAAPVLGTTIDLTTSNPTTQGLGVNFLALVGIPAPGINLAVLGAPGCAALVDPSTAVGNLISNLGAGLPPLTVTLPIPANPALTGLQIFSQSIWLDAAANAFGAITSNGVNTTLGMFAL